MAYEVDDPLFEEKVQAPPPKVIQPLMQEDRDFYSELFMKHLHMPPEEDIVVDDIFMKDLPKYEPPKNDVANHLISVRNLEKIMGETPFRLFEDPEAVQQNINEIDPECTGFFGLESWLNHMTIKSNYVEEDLVKSFKVFDLDDTGVVNKDELKIAFMSLIGREQVNEHDIALMF